MNCIAEENSYKRRDQDEEDHLQAPSWSLFLWRPPCRSWGIQTLPYPASIQSQCLHDYHHHYFYGDNHNIVWLYMYIYDYYYNDCYDNDGHDHDNFDNYNYSL